MATILDLQDRGLRYGVIVDAAATTATLAAIERAGLRYKVEVASGITAADRAVLDRRGLQYFVPVAATVSMADRAILERQGLRYAVQVDPTVLPADLAALERQGLSYFVEVDSSGTAIATAAGGAILLVDETNGFATDFTHAVDAERVAVKTAGTVVASTMDGFFTNAGTSPKMVFDSAGTLVWSPHNLLFDSGAFGSANWTLTGCTVSSNAVAAPNGLLEADAIIPSAGSVNVTINNGSLAVTNGAPYTFSLYAKNGTLGNDWFQIVIYASTIWRGWFNLATGAKGSSLSSPTSYNITALSDGWYKLDITASVGAATGQVYLGPTPSDGSVGNVTGDGVKPAAYIWGGQLNRGTVPTAYLPTTTTARYGLAIDYDPVTHAAKGLLCEPAATNKQTWSNDLSNSVTAAGGTVTVNNQTGPDGLLTADTFTEDTATSTHGGYGSDTVVANTDYTLSRFMKMGTRRYASLGWSDGTNGAYGVYDLQSGVVGSSAALGTGTLNSASIQACSNGWYRCILSGKFPAGTTAYYTQQAATAATITADGFGRQTFLGTGATLFMGHVQIETGTVATSPIPTSGAAVTRAADAYNCTPASIGYSATAGSWWVETYLLDGSGERILIGTNSSSWFPIYYTNGAFEVGLPQLYKLDSNILNISKAMSAFQAGDRAVTSNGLVPATDTGITTGLLGPTTIYFGTGVGLLSTLGYIRKVRYLPRRPSNAEMQTMTT